MANNETTTKFKVDISELKKAMQEAKRSISVANSEFKAVSSSMDDWTKSTDGINAKLKQLDTTMSAQKTILNNLEAQYEAVKEEQGENSKAADDLLIKINNQRAAINNTQKQINKWTESLNDLESESNQAGKASDKLGDSLEEAGDSADKAEGGFTVLKATIADLAAQAISNAVGALKDFVSQAGEVDKAINGLQTSTGATAKEMKQYEKVMKDIYNSNYGESYDDVAESMSKVLQTMGDLDDVDLNNITTNGLVLRDTFGFELPESIRAVNSLMDQFGVTADEAYNLIAQGAQNGLNQNDDLLDVINEYSVHFQNLGYSADDMFNMLVSGAESGTWSVDKLGDAMKEFNIRSSDGTVTDAINENAKLLGLSAKEAKLLGENIKEGSVEGYEELINRIEQVSDYTDRYNLGVAMFGTMWEDLGESAVYALMRTEGELSSTKATMDDIKNIKYDDVGNSLQTLGRLFNNEILTPIKDHIAPKVKEFVDYCINNFPQIKKTAMDSFLVIKKIAIEVVNEFKEWIPTIITIGTAIATYFVATKIIAFIDAIKNGTLALKLMTVAQTALNAVFSLSPIGLVTAAIAALVVAFVMLWNKSDAFRGFWIGLWDNIVNVTTTVVEKIKGAFDLVINFFKDNWQSILLFILNPFAGVFNILYNKFDGFRDFVDTTINAIITFFINLWDKIVEIFSPATTWFSQLFTSIHDTLKSMIEVAIVLIKGVWTIITTVFGIAKNWFTTNVITPVSNAFTTMWNAIKNLAATTWEGIKSVFSVVANWFNTTVITPVSNVFTTVWNNMKTGAANAWSGIKSVFSTVGTFFKNTFTNAWTSVKNVFSTGGKIFDGIKEGIVSMFKTIVNAIIRGINKVVSVPFNAINKVLNKIKNTSVAGITPFSGLPNISIPSIPELAKGGILKRGQIGLLEGNGAEAVVPLEKNTQWIRGIAKQLARELGVSASSVTAGTVGVGGVVNNYNQVINSPKALTRLEIYRQSKNLLSFNGGAF